MPIHTTPIDFPIQDATTLRFVGHCTQHWNNFALCSDAHVAFMKHLACYIFNLPAATQLIGILFEVFSCSGNFLMVSDSVVPYRTRRSC